MSGNRGKARISAQEWETLYRQYLRKLEGYFASRGFDPPEAEDLAHDVFQELGQEKVPEDTHAYIYAIARNILSRRCRREITERAALGEYCRRMTRDDRRSGSRTLDTAPSEEAGIGEAEQILRAIVAKLPPKDAELVALRLFQRLSTRQVAQRMNCSENVVRKRLRKLKAAIRRLYRE